MAWATRVPSYSTIRGCSAMQLCPAGASLPAPGCSLAWRTLGPRLPHYVCAEGHQSRYHSSGAVASPDHQDVRKLEGVSVSTHGARPHPLIHAATPLKLARMSTQ